jgi:Di-haem oxidoreductase, putative peroxidase
LSRNSLVTLASVVLLAGAASAQVGNVAIQAPMGSPVPGLTPSQLDRFQKGFIEFDHQLSNAEGLGPTFNDTGCSQCHSGPKTGGASDIFVTRFGKTAVGMTPFDPLANLGGSLLQAHAIDEQCQEVIPVEATVTAHRETPSVFGAGLVEAIPDSVLLGLQNSPPPNVSGTAHILQLLEDPFGRSHVGRFGWKAQVATMLSFSGDASLNEMGLTNALVGTENAPNGNQALLAQFDLVADPEDHPDGEGFTRIQRMTDFQRFLAPPPQTPKSGMAGEAIFNSIGCANCHVPSYTTGSAPEAALSNKVIRPYSDFLLHDMGHGLGDGIVQGYGTEREMRTSSLWGVSARAPGELLHDGRATGGSAEQNIDTAILDHASDADLPTELSEARFAKQAYLALTSTQKAQLAAFLMSLGQQEFDEDHSQFVDATDWFFIAFNGWFQGPGANNVNPDAPSAVADIDQDGDVDLVDFGLLQRAMTP